MKNLLQDNYTMKEILTLKKQVKKQKKVKDVFKSLNITEAGGRAIGIAQNNFENFWSHLDRIEASQYEKKQCLNKLKEACFWINRGIAKFNEVKEE